MTSLRRWIVIVLLLVVGLGYPLAWDADLYMFGIAVLILAPVQFAVAAVGIVARILRRDSFTGMLAWAADALLIAAGAGALAFLRSISWS